MHLCFHEVFMILSKININMYVEHNMLVSKEIGNKSAGV